MGRLGLRVRELAEQRGFTQATLLAAMLRLSSTANFSRDTVAGYWHNTTRRPDLDILDAVAQVLEVEPGDLLARRVSDHASGAAAEDAAAALA